MIAEMINSSAMKSRIAPALSYLNVRMASMPNDPDWTRSELILVCEALRANGWQAIRATDPRAVHLSGLLRAMDIHPRGSRGDKFRSAASVQRKGYDLLTQLPGYDGKPTRGGRLDVDVLKAFWASPAEMSMAAAATERALTQDSGQVEAEQSFVPEDAELVRPEGELLYRRHRLRERSPLLRRRKLEQAITDRGRLDCEVCCFDGEQSFGEAGRGLIEVHHLVPLSVTGAKSTRLADLALLCGNCHATAHRLTPWPTVPGLRLMRLDRGSGELR